jgi:hypothetical protein
MTVGEFECGHGHRTNQMIEREAGVGVPIVMAAIQTTMENDVEAGVSKFPVRSVLVIVHLGSPAPLRQIFPVLRIVQAKQKMLPTIVQPV